VAWKGGLRGWFASDYPFCQFKSPQTLVCGRIPLPFISCLAVQTVYPITSGLTIYCGLEHQFEELGWFDHIFQKLKEPTRFLFGRMQVPCISLFVYSFLVGVPAFVDPTLNANSARAACHTFLQEEHDSAHALCCCAPHKWSCYQTQRGAYSDI